MNSLTKHNITLREFLLSPDNALIKNLIDLDSIDSVLRKLLNIEEMREAGCFFTGQQLASRAVSKFKVPITSNSLILDPTCGAGNLLIEVSRKLDINVTLSKTLKMWGRILWGFDTNSHFIEATKLRLVIEALNRGVIQDCGIDEALTLLPNISVQDALSLKEGDLENFTHVIMNPPFTIWPSPKKNYWKTGKVNAAGIILDTYIRLLPEGCNMSAILPDVLRSGSRYHDFREFVSHSVNANVEIWGRFNKKTDVDVFLLSGILERPSLPIQWYKSENGPSLISNFFNVTTGPLVAYRAPEEGPESPYFYSKNCPQGETLKTVAERRRFSGKLLKPPLVLLKRTSSPYDKYRASATLIILNEPVAIENHLIVLTPKDGKVSTCRKLLKILANQKTNDFLNERIRLRHLTVGVVKDIPFIEDE